MIARVLSIAVKELIPVVIAAVLYGRQWQGQVVQFCVDNQAVVHVLQSTYSTEPHLMHLVRVLIFLASHFDFWFTSIHMSGSNNTIVDALSRNHIFSSNHRFLTLLQPFQNTSVTGRSPNVQHHLDIYCLDTGIFCSSSSCFYSQDILG